MVDAPPLAPVAPQPAPLIVRKAETHADLAALHMLRLAQGAEMAEAPVNADKVMLELVEAWQDRENHELLMAVRDGRLIGCLLLHKRSYGYSDHSFLIDFGFYVLPAYRGDDVGPSLLACAREIAEAKGLALKIVINNPARRRGSRSAIERSAVLMGFVPQGAVLTFHRENADVLRQ